MQSPLEVLLNQSQLDIEKALSYVKQGYNANTKNTCGETILHRIVTRERSVLSFLGITTPQLSSYYQGLIKDLIHKYQADPNAKDHARKTPLHRLVETEFATVHDVDFLVANGADPRCGDTQPVIHRFVLGMNSAPNSPCRDLIKKYAMNFPGFINYKNRAGKTALQCLLDTDYSVNDVLFLAELGADVNLENSKKNPTIFALAFAQSPMSEQTKVIIHKLIHRYGANINQKNSEGKTLLQCLLDNPFWSTEDIRFLLSIGADPDTCDSRGQPLFHRLVLDERNHNSFIALLVDRYLVNPNCKNVEGKTALQCYLDRKLWFTHMMLYLVSLGADPMTMDSRGQSLIHRLVMYDRGERAGIACHNKCAISILVNMYHVKPHTKNAQGLTALECLKTSNKWTPRDVDFLNSFNHTREMQPAHSLHVILKEGARPIHNHPLSEEQVKRIVAPLQSYYDKTKIVFFGHNHLTWAQALIGKIMEYRRIPVIFHYLRVEESTFDAVGASNFELAIMGHDSIEEPKKLSTMYKTKEESGYYRAITNALTILTTVLEEQQHHLQQDHQPDKKCLDLS